MSTTIAVPPKNGSARAPKRWIRRATDRRTIRQIRNQTHEVTIEIHTKLTATVKEHQQLFLGLYPQLVKIKFHYLWHVPDDLYRLGYSISCFAMERRHKDWKSFVLWCFKHFESTSTRDALNLMLHQICSKQFKFDAYWLDDPRKGRLLGDIEVEVASVVHTPFATLTSGDVVLASLDGAVHAVGRVGRFLSVRGEIVTTFERFRRAGNGWHKVPAEETVIDVQCIRCLLYTSPSPRD